MKLYSRDLSPFAAAVRIAIYANSLPIEIVSPPAAGTRSPDYLAVNPLGKVPALVLADGATIPESLTILEYLADAYPQSGLRPTEPKAAARTRLVSRVGEIYVLIPSSPLFGQLNPADRNPASVDAGFEKMTEGLGQLNTFLSDEGFAASSQLTIADCVLVPELFILGVLGNAFGRGDPIAQHPKVAAYWARVQKHPAIAKVLGEMQEGLKALQASMAAPQPA